MNSSGRFVCLMLILLAGLTACQKSDYHCILPADVHLLPGDVVFRRGEGLSSRVVIAADRNGQYSHVGIVVDSCGMPMIVHAVPYEPDFEGDIDRVKLDSPERFFSSGYASIGEVRRLDAAETATRVAAVAYEYYRRGVPFDHDYDDSDSTKMYCTELVVSSLREAGYDLHGLEYQEVNLPFLQARCLLPSTVCNLPVLKLVVAF